MSERVVQVLDAADVTEVRRIPVKDGEILEVTMTQAFTDRVRQHFGLLPNQPVEDDQVRLYVYGAFNTAVERAERDLKEHQEAPEGVR